MSRRSPRFAATLLLVCCGLALAAPAPWYRWRSKTDGQTFCSQTPPGAGWEKSGGPYQDPRCRRPGKPGE